jgi:2-oxoglutarate dehydrogenase complex dehydrogenase (E1) component-like enzyme
MLRVSNSFNLDYYWLQEESENQGGYTFVAPRLQRLLPAGMTLKYHGRKPSAAPATGVSSVYKQEQKYVINGIFEDL